MAPVAPVTRTLALARRAKPPRGSAGSRTDPSPPERQQSHGRADLDDVPGQEGPEPELERALGADKVREPRDAQRENDHVSENHREQGRRRAPVPSAFGERAADPGSGEKAGQVAASRPDERVGTGCSAREDRKAGRSLPQVREHRRGAVGAPQERPDEEHGKSLAGHGYGRERERERDLGRERDQEAPEQDQREVVAGGRRARTPRGGAGRAGDRRAP